MASTGTSSTTTAAAAGTGLRRDVGRIGLLFTSIGSIIGSGWLFGALNASKQAGPAAVVSWALGGVMILLIALVYAELGAMYPVSGGVVRFPHFAFGSFASYTAGWITWLAAASVAPIEVEAALQYATNYVPWLTHEVDGVQVFQAGGYVVAVVLMAVFCVVNFYGVRWFARFNTAIVWWKLAIITLVIVAFLLSTFHGDHFTGFGGFTPNGWHGVFSSIATAGIVFSYLGFRQGVELAGESKNPGRNVPIAVIGSVLVCTLIYIGLQVAFIGAVPDSSLAKGWSNLSFAGDFGPLAGIATILGMAWLAGLLYADAIISPGDTGLIYTTVTSRISYAMGKNENAPRGLTRLNGNGAPWVSLVLAFLVGLLFFLPFPGWQKLVGFITSATVLSFGSGPIVLAAMRRELPDERRPFRLPGGDVLPFLAFWSSNLIVYWTGWETNWKLFVAILIGYVLLVVHKATGGHPHGFEWRSGSWVFPWLVGLAVISWIGNYGGGLGLLGFGTGFIATFLLSLLVFVWGVTVRLHRDTMTEHIATSRYEEPDEGVETVDLRK
ncbi:MAG: APC family permease [Motilibacteraceae bacterium]